MPEQRSLALFRWGEELRRRRVALRNGRRRIALAAMAGAVAASLLATVAWAPRPLLLWNASASMPLGLYLVESAKTAAPGDVVVARLPAGVRSVAEERQYLQADVPLVKHVAASEGDRVCAVGDAVLVNRGLMVLRRSSDRHGRPLPSWTGCCMLGRGEVLLLGETAESFDGRYFGISERRDLVGRARLLWAR